ncbi:MAG: orotidine-5'-phosphate decarboxylase [Actinomycetota bacterium]|nr:orotidine-5'-phosphate decarboxylase [Actinomycetota bacterium]
MDSHSEKNINSKTALLRNNLKVKDRLILSLDVSSKFEAMEVLKKVSDSISTIKVGLELIYNEGLEIVDMVKKAGYKVLLDAKLMDIPNTVAGALRGINKIDVGMITIHTSGGTSMLKNASETLNEICIQKNKSKPLLFGVTVLTSLDDDDLKKLGYDLKFTELVLRMAKVAIDCDIDGIICSPNEVKLLRENFGHGFLIATPGIRLAQDNPGDQKRINTPEKAIRDGSDFLIVGRSIIKNTDIKGKINSYLDKIEGELENDTDN